MVALGIVGLLAAPLLVGHLFGRAFFPSGEKVSLGETLFVQYLAGVLLCGGPALLLAELGWLTLPHLAVVVLGGCAVLLAARWPAVRRWRWPRVAVDLRGGLILVLVLAVGFLFLVPGEWVLGGQDPASYVSTAASIARTGGIVLHDPWIASLPPAARPLALTDYIGQWWVIPGFYVTDLAAGQITPQFLHLYPTWLALFHLAGGLSFTLAATPLITLLGVVAFYFLAGRIVGRWAAPAALVLLALNPAQIWFARHPGAESLTLVLLMGGWYLFHRMTAEPDRRDLAVLAGLALGQIALTKIELLTLPLVIYGYLLLRSGMARLPANEKVFALVYGVVLVHALAHMALISWPYLVSLRTSLDRSGTVPGAIWFLAVGLAVAGVGFLFLARRPIGRFLRRLQGSEAVLRRAAVVLWLLAVLYGAIIWPALTPVQVQVEGQWYDNANRLAFERLLWYLSPLGLGLALLGVAWWLGRRLDRASLPFFAAFLFESAVYLHSTMDDPLHFWMMRRYIPLVFPCLTLAIAGVVGWVRQVPLGRTVRRGGAALLVGLLIFLALPADRPIAARREFAGAIASLEDLAAQIPDRAPVFVDHFGVALSMPLRFLYGKEAFSLPQPKPWEELWPLWQVWPADAEAFYLLLETPPFALHGGTAVVQVGDFLLETWCTEAAYWHRPRDVERVRSVQQLYRVQRRPDEPAGVELSFLAPMWSGASITVDLPAPEKPLCLRLRAAAFRPDPLPPARLEVRWLGRTTAIEMARSFDLQDLVWELPPPAKGAVSGDEVRLELYCPTWNPQAVGFGDDPRDLGIQVQSLRLQEGACAP